MNHVMFVFNKDSDGRFDSSAFVTNCDRLRRNDPTIRTVDAAANWSVAHTDFWPGYGHPLGQALLHNTVVNRLCLDPLLFFHDEQVDYDEATAAPMLEYLKTRPSLRSVRLDVKDAFEPSDMYESQLTLQGQILVALAQNSNVMIFSSTTNLPQREFVQFLTSRTMAVRSCRLEEFAMRSFTDTTELAVAFEANQSIRRLFMNCTGHSWRHVGQVIRQLDARSSSAHPTGPDLKVTVALSNLTFLHRLMHSTRVLNALILRRISIDEEGSMLLCNGLALNQSVKKLSLIDCDLSKEATLEFTAFVQSKVNRGANKLNHLHFDSWIPTLGITRMLMGSALHTLEVGRNMNNFLILRVLFEQLVLNDASIRLHRLWLTKPLQQCDAALLSRYLAQTSSLQELRFEWSSSSHHDLRVLVPAFRANGSLVRVRVKDSSKGTNSLLFCCSFSARNSKLAMLMRAYDCDEGNDAERSCAIAPLPLSLAPSLFAASQQAPRTAATVTLTGLLALSDSLGKASSDKLRMRH
jgi:hypothetical protein